MYLGRFKTYFSGKNRLILPKKFRRELGSEDKFYIIMGPDGDIWGFDIGNWHKMVEDVLGAPLFSKEGRAGRRKFFSGAEECFLDSQGRFVIPQEFIDKARLGEGILLIGAGDHFEIWNPKEWEKIMEER